VACVLCLNLSVGLVIHVCSSMTAGFYLNRYRNHLLQRLRLTTRRDKNLSVFSRADQLSLLAL
jgi:hypothetical protein